MRLSASSISYTASWSEDNRLKAQYVKQRGFDDDHYKKMIVEYLRTYGSATRKDLDELLLAKLPEILSPSQKNNKVSNLLGALRHSDTVKNAGTTAKPKYVLTHL